MELAEPARGPNGPCARAKEDIPEGAHILNISGAPAVAPAQNTIQVDAGFHLAADNALWGSIHHSCDPNCAINFNTWTFYAARPVECGEVLTYNRLTTEWELAAPFRCACGAGDCSGRIAGFKHLPHSRQEELALFSSPYLMHRLFELAPLKTRRSSGVHALKPRSAVYVFIPYAFKDGRIESFDYDIPSFRAEVRGWFDSLDLPWRWVPITHENLGRTIERLRAFAEAGDIMVLNLCDGSDIDSSPGVSVVRALENAGIPFTGGSSHFYAITTPKVMMKEELVSKGVPTPPFAALRDPAKDVFRLESEVGFPALIKPEVSSGSNGISLNSLVSDASSAEAQISRLFLAEYGEFYRSSGVFAERFVEGPEFTVLVVGNHEQPQKVRVYPPVERLFHSALPPRERFLSHDRYWSEFKEESRPPEGEPFYRYALAPASLGESLADLARRAFFALGGTGYARVDMRRDAATGELFVLEVNSNCGLSGDRETSVGEILHLTGIPIHSLISEILQAAADRQKLLTRDEHG